MSLYEERLVRFQEVMRDHGANLALLSAREPMRYLCGWWEEGHERLIALIVPAEGLPALVVPAMSREQAAANPAGILEVRDWIDSEGWGSCMRWLMDLFAVTASGLVLVDDALPAVHLLALQSMTPCRYVPAGEALSALRICKSEPEIAALERAAEMIDIVFDEVSSSLREGMSEMELSRAVLQSIERQGSRPSFPPLVCFGANGSMPHHGADDTRLKQGDVVIIDIGCASGDYLSDITRTIAFGEPIDPEARRVYEVVSRAHHAARLAAKPGVTGAHVDEAARRVIEEAGWGPQFVHRTGHGIGMSPHEPPFLVAGDAQRLAPGMCFSIEPGIYLPGRFGVRIENIVVMTEHGVRSLNAEPPAQLMVVQP
jgi:Xaa-Pro aminopeptidase